jgi:hypothetical protein
VQQVAHRRLQDGDSRHSLEQVPRRLEQYREVQPKLIIRASSVPFGPPFVFWRIIGWAT